MPLASYSYNSATAALTPLLDGLPPVVITLDGRPGSGKTTLGRYLAWHFNITLVETDLFLERQQGFQYRWKDLAQVVSARLAAERPVIVEGVAVGWILRELGLEAAFTVYCDNSGPSSRNSPLSYVASYESGFAPRQRANLVIELFH